MKKEEVLRRVTEGGLVAVVRAASGEEAKRITDACIAGGVVGIEITFTIPGAHHVMEELAKVKDAVVSVDVQMAYSPPARPAKNADSVNVRIL